MPNNQPLWKQVGCDRSKYSQNSSKDKVSGFLKNNKQSNNFHQKDQSSPAIINQSKLLFQRSNSNQQSLQSFIHRMNNQSAYDESEDSQSILIEVENIYEKQSSEMHQISHIKQQSIFKLFENCENCENLGNISNNLQHQQPSIQESNQFKSKVFNINFQSPIKISQMKKILSLIQELKSMKEEIIQIYKALSLRVNMILQRKFNIMMEYINMQHFKQKQHYQEQYEIQVLKNNYLELEIQKISTKFQEQLHQLRRQLIQKNQIIQQINNNRTNIQQSQNNNKTTALTQQTIDLQKQIQQRYQSKVQVLQQEIQSLKKQNKQRETKMEYLQQNVQMQKHYIEKIEEESTYINKLWEQKNKKQQIYDELTKNVQLQEQKLKYLLQIRERICSDTIQKCQKTGIQLQVSRRKVKVQEEYPSKQTQKNDKKQSMRIIKNNIIRFDEHIAFETQKKNPQNHKHFNKSKQLVYKKVTNSRNTQKDQNFKNSTMKIKRGRLFQSAKMSRITNKIEILKSDIDRLIH